MNKKRTVDLLYKKAHGQKMNATKEEEKELKKYKVFSNDAKFATRKILNAHVDAINKGSKRSLYDRAMDKGMADRRRKGGSAAALRSEDREGGLASMFMGWLTWGICLYWMAGGRAEVKGCAILGLIISFILYKISRRNVFVTCFLFPVILTVIVVKVL